MTTVTFTLDNDNNLLAIDRQTGFPETIPLTIEGLQKIKDILHSSDEAMRKEYYSRIATIASERHDQQLNELEELF